MKRIFVASTVLLGTLAGTFALAAAVSIPAPLKAAVGKMVKGDVILAEKGVEGVSITHKLQVKAASSDVIELEVKEKDLSLVEAEGKTFSSQVDFVPGQGLKTLAELRKAVAKNKAITVNEWSLDQKFNGDWIYELTGVENGTKKEWEYNAKTLELVKTEND